MFHLSFFICQFESQAARPRPRPSAHSTATMLTIFGSLPSPLPSLQPLPCHSKPSTRQRTICPLSALTHSLTHSSSKFRKRFRFALGERHHRLSQKSATNARSALDDFSAATPLFFCNPHPHRIRRRRRRSRHHHHPDGNVTLWHPRKKRRGGETRLRPSSCLCLCLCLRLCPCGRRRRRHVE